MIALKYVNKNQYLFLNMLLYRYIDLFKSRQLNVSDKKENSGFKLAQLVKSSIVEKEIWDSILAYTKNHLVYLSDNKKLSSGAGIISWNSLKKKKKIKKKTSYIYNSELKLR